MSSRLPVIVNAAAGTVGEKEAALQAELAGHFLAAGVEAHITLAKPADLVEAVRRAIAKKPRVLAIGGGDGTLNCAAQLLVGTGIALGILPLGTLNHFAKDLHVPLDIRAAAQNIVAGHIAKVDVGVVNEHHFLNNSSLGLYPQMVEKREVQRVRLRRGKWPAFVFAAVSILRRYPFLDVRLSIEGSKVVRRTPFVFIGNNRYEMEGFRIGSRPRLDRGELSLYVAPRVGRAGLLVLALSALFRRLDQARDFETVCATNIQIDTRRGHLHVATDGEVSVMTAPLRYRVRPKALSVIVPEAAKAD